MKRPELLARLRVLEKKAKRADAAAAAKHRKDEERYLNLFRIALRKGYENALKISYIDARNMSTSVYVDIKDSKGRKVYKPRCPDAMADRITGLIALVERTAQDRFVINLGGQYASLHRVLTADVGKTQKSVCT
jgi:hypothetical protein